MFAFVSAAYRNGRVVRDPDAILQQGKDTCLDVENNNDTACCVWETDDWAAAYASLVGKFILVFFGYFGYFGYRTYGQLY